METEYSYCKDFNYNFEIAEEKVRAALLGVGFGVLMEINIDRAFKEKLNIDYKKYKILGACIPQLAHKALKNEDMIGVLMPCNILIIDNEDATTKIVFPNAKKILEVTNNENIFSLADKVDELLCLAFNNIK